MLRVAKGLSWLSAKSLESISALRAPAALSVTLSFSLFFSLGASAASKQPYDFDVKLAEKPDEVARMIEDYSLGLPGLPLQRLTEIELDGPIKIKLFSEAAHFLELLVQTDKSDFVWPRDVDSCAAHFAFVLPEIPAPGAASNCQGVADEIRADLSNLSVCRDAAEPELYVLEYPPGVVNDGNTRNVLDLIGVMGSTFTQLPPLYNGVLPGDFVPRLRDILRKLRYQDILGPLNAQIASQENALHLMRLHEDCFVAGVLADTASDIEDLLSESRAWRDYIERLKAIGEASYQMERARLELISRERKELPYPTLTQDDREFLAFWLGALYWRLRGGGIIELGGTQECRRLGLRHPFNVIGEIGGLDDGKEAAEGIYCEIFSGWGQWFDMGTTPGQEDKYYDLVKMTNRGYEQIRTAVSGSSLLNSCTIPEAPFLLNIDGLNKKGYDTVELYGGGLTMGPCYYFAWDQLWPWFYAWDLDPPYIQVIDGPTAIGEFCAGGSIALGLVRTLMKGWSTGTPPPAGADALFFQEPDIDNPLGCAIMDKYARISVIPLDANGRSLPPGQSVALLENPPYVVSGGVEAHTDPLTGVTEYLLLVGSNRCIPGALQDIRVNVNGVELQSRFQLEFACPGVATDGVAFSADPSEVVADGRSASTITVRLQDSCANAAIGRGISVDVLGGVPANISSAQVMSIDSLDETLAGTAQVMVSSLYPGSIGLVVTIDGERFESEPELVVFVEGVEALFMSSPSEGSILREERPTFRGRGEPGRWIVIEVDGQEVAQVQIDEEGYWEWSPEEPLKEGDVAITIRYSDGTQESSYAFSVDLFDERPDDSGETPDDRDRQPEEEENVMDETEDETTNGLPPTGESAGCSCSVRTQNQGPGFIPVMLALLLTLLLANRTKAASKPVAISNRL